MSGIEDFLEPLDYPVYVVTAAAGGERAGCLVGFGGQTSIHPPRFTVWISKANRTYDVAQRSTLLGVHTLTRDDGHELARLFGAFTADDGVDKFARVPCTPGLGGVPLLDQAAAWFVGRVLDRADAGDHVGFLLEPRDCAARHPGPVLMYRDVQELDAGHPA